MSYLWRKETNVDVQRRRWWWCRRVLPPPSPIHHVKRKEGEMNNIISPAVVYIPCQPEYVWLDGNNKSLFGRCIFSSTARLWSAGDQLLWRWSTHTIGSSSSSSSTDKKLKCDISWWKTLSLVSPKCLWCLTDGTGFRGGKKKIFTPNSGSSIFPFFWRSILNVFI